MPPLISCLNSEVCITDSWIPQASNMSSNKPELIKFLKSSYDSDKNSPIGGGGGGQSQKGHVKYPY